MAHVPQEQRREQLIEAALVVMATSGLDGATSRRIAAAADAPLASIHYTFGSLEWLLLAAYERATDEVVTKVRASVDPAAGFEALPPSIADAVGELVVDDRYGLLLQDLAPSGDDRFRAIEARYLAVGGEIVRAVATASNEEPAFDPDQMGRLIVAAIDGTVVQLLAHGDTDQAHNDLLVLLRRIVTREPATQTTATTGSSDRARSDPADSR